MSIKKQIFLVAVCSGVMFNGAAAYAEDSEDSALAQGEQALADIASEAIGDKCPCPSSETAATVKKLDKCLAAQEKKAKATFSSVIKFASLSSREFRRELTQALADYKVGCFAPPEDPEDEFEEGGEEFPTGDDFNNGGAF